MLKSWLKSLERWAMNRMSKFYTYLFCLSIGFAVVSCTEEADEVEHSESEGIEVDSVPEVVEIEMVEEEPDVESHVDAGYRQRVLSNYFMPDMVDSVLSIYDNANQLDSGLSFRSYYVNITSTIEHCNQIGGENDAFGSMDEDLFYKMMDFFYENNKKFSPLIVGCAGECTMLELTLDMRVMKEMAFKYGDSKDSIFLELADVVSPGYGFMNDYGFPGWFMQTWDYGGASMLGNGQLLDAIQLYIQLKAMNISEYCEHLDRAYDAFRHSLSSEIRFMNTYESVFQEMEQILNLGFFEGEDLELIKEHYANMKELKGFYFNCAQGDCGFRVMKRIVLLFQLLMFGCAYGQNVLISDEKSPCEPSIKINPLDVSQIMGGAVMDHCYISEDTGRTWHTSQLKSQYGVYGDPVIDVDY